MSTMAKDSEILSPGGAGAARPEESAARTQPVALEVPVSVNGARTVEGSDKREPFSEATKTVLIFASGAVIRLGSTVAAGQLLFLTNDNTKKEVVCQVVKSRHYSGVSGYVELEFTEPASGFWGMRFPAERPGALHASPGIAKSAPSTPKSVSGGSPSSPATAKPEIIKASAPAVSPISTSVPKPASVLSPAAATSDAEELKREAARLQDQLSGVLFADGPGHSKPGREGSTERPAGETKSKVIEMPGKAEAPTSAPGSQNPASAVPAELKPRPDLTAGEVKIPAWLEPLARNASIPAPAEEPQTNIAEVIEPAPVAEEAPAIPNEGVRETETPGISGFSADISTPTFGGQIFGDPHSGEFDAREKRSGSGVLIGLLAAGLLAAAAGGVWYFKLWPPASGQAPSNPQVFATLPPADRTNEASAQAAQEKPPVSFASKESSPRSTVRQAAVEPPRTAPGVEPPPMVNARERERIASSRNLESANATPVEPVEQQKKPALGKVKLAAPTVNANGAGAEDVAAPHFGSGAPAIGDAANAGMIAGGSGEPAAPVPVGGDVKSARLLHGVPPVYPPIAKSQRISGDVKMDALVDPTGRVTTMKIVSGPVLLHQAAKDAVRQWRYQPAMLDGKPVPMHLTVTVQFRLQ